MDEQALTDLFRKLGAREPESWARSQIDEGIPQLARFVFLRQAWKEVVGGSGASWLAGLRRHAEATGGKLLDALKRMEALGVTEDELTTIVRSMQGELLFRICHLLEDPGELEPEIGDMGWGLFQIDQDGHPTGGIAGLHESVLETDPLDGL